MRRTAGWHDAQVTDSPELTAGQDLGPRAVRPGRRPVIAGLGLTELGKVYGRSPEQFAAAAVRAAAADAGIPLSAVDGLLTSSGVTRGVSIDLQRDLGLTDLRLLTHMQAFGSTAGSMVQYAALAVQSGLASVVACVFADSPLRPERRSSAIYGTRHAGSGWWGLLGASGVVGANPMYALAARRHMDRYGTTSEQLGHIAVAQREWAALNPAAQLREPITLADHQASRWIVEPFHLLDCCLVSNGGIAVLVTYGGAGRAHGAAAGAPARLGAGASGPVPAPSPGVRAGVRGRAGRPRGAARWPGSASPTSTSRSCMTATPSPCC